MTDIGEAFFGDLASANRAEFEKKAMHMAKLIHMAGPSRWEAIMVKFISTAPNELAFIFCTLMIDAKWNQLCPAKTK